MGDLPGNVATSAASGISADGSVIVGTGQTSVLFFVGQGKAFRWTATTGMVGLGDLPGGFSYSRANATSSDGSVVVGMSFSETNETAFRWTETGGMESVLDLLVKSGVDMTGWRLTNASSISADGQVIVGYGINPSGYGEGWVADFRSVPEPSASWLFLLAIAAGFALIQRNVFRRLKGSGLVLEVPARPKVGATRDAARSAECAVTAAERAELALVHQRA
jgi:probable HAF family extracellular repeat protein